MNDWKACCIVSTVVTAVCTAACGGQERISLLAEAAASGADDAKVDGILDGGTVSDDGRPVSNDGQSVSNGGNRDVWPVAPDAGDADSGLDAETTPTAISAAEAGPRGLDGSDAEAGESIESGVGSLTGLKVSIAPAAFGMSVHVEAVLVDPADAILTTTVSVSPDDVNVSGSTSTWTLSGLAPKTTHAFTVTATTQSGRSLTETTNPLAFYDVVETFVEPECAYNTVFSGSFTFDTIARTVSSLSGNLTEAMDEPTTSVSLTHQLSTEVIVVSGISGLLVTTFALTTTATFAGGTWAPGGTRTYGNHNAYALIFVNASDPTTALTSAQVDRLAYADCAPKGLMGPTCMTATTTRAYGREGTMQGYPISQVTTLR